MNRFAQIKHTFSTVGATYDTHAVVQRLVAQRLAEKVQGKPNAKGCVLEVGCGTGLLSTHLVPQAQTYLLTDVALPLLERAWRKVADQPHVVPLVVDGERLCFTASFDLIVANLALHWFQDPKAAIGRLVASLKPGGELYLTVCGNNSLHEWRMAHHVAEAPCGVLDFPSFGQFKEWFPLTGKRHVEEEWVTFKPENALSFLRSLKGMGSHLAHPGHTPLPPQSLRKVMQVFDEDPQVSCQILYGYYQKPEKMREE